MTTDRIRARRKALHAEVKARLEPRLAGLGYERTRTREARRRWGDESKYYGFGRQRDGAIELVDVQWGKYGRADFKLSFQRYLEAEGPLPREPGFRIGGAMPPLDPLERLFGDLRMRFGYGERQTIDSAVSQAIVGLDQIETFLRSGDVGDHLSLSDFRDMPSWQRWLLWPLWLIGPPLVLLAQSVSFLFAEFRGKRRSR